jgi:predicted RND superfamily exporter protein
MLLCWVATYLVLPALVLRFAPGPNEAYDHAGGSALGRILARIFGAARPSTVLWVAGVLGVIALGIVTRYLIADPFEYDMHALRSIGPASVESQRWLRISDATFGKSISGRIIIAADRPEQVPLIVDALKKIDADLPTDDRVIGGVSSILDVIPPDQYKRLEVLGEIRTMLDSPAIQQLAQEDQALVRELRPPDDLHPVTPEILPPEIREQLAERDGRVGLLVSVRPGPKLDQWNGRDLIRLADAVRTLRLADGETVTTSGTSVIFADIMAALEHDGPLVTTVAACGLVLMVVLVTGRRRIGIAVLITTCAGSLAMVAVCALVGLRVNFLDFVALPITLGLGVDYAINVAHRAQAGANPTLLLQTTGSAVLVCSMTTMIGYASLLFGQNQAIRGFGLASLIGEITCVIAALALVPAIVFAGRRWA